MDFFEHQESARRRTGWLLLVFLIGVGLVVVSVDLAMVVCLFFFDESTRPGETIGAALLNPGLFAVISGSTAAVIFGGSLYRLASLAGGGHVVADQLGGRLIQPGTVDLAERRLLNVVEEMAIAAGTPVPPVYVLEDSSINAFAAGNAPTDAVIGVTRGCLEQLTRDELQGVIGHEFSHILNGDMRLNLRLMAILFGILLIGQIGWILMRTSSRSSRLLGARSSKKGGNPLPLVGLALYIVGYSGVFFGNLVKAAINRQREFLADAASVQFTRNPDGLAGALRKIAAASGGSLIDNTRAAEASHLFFGQATRAGTLFGLLATHPPIAERIRRLEVAEFPDAVTERPPESPTDSVELRSAGSTPVVRPMSPRQAVERIGTITAMGLAEADTLKAELPGTPEQLAREPFSARAVIYALLLDACPEMRDRQRAIIAQRAEPGLLELVDGLAEPIAALRPGTRLPLVSLCVPALRQLSRRQFAAFNQTVEDLVRVDNHVDVFEFPLQRHLLAHLTSRFTKPDQREGTPTPTTSAVESAAVVLSALSRVGSKSEAECQSAFDRARTGLGWAGLPEVPLPLASAGSTAVVAALDRLNRLSPRRKRAVLEAAAAAVQVDQRITVREAELLRAVSDGLNCPMPPLPREDSDSSDV